MNFFHQALARAGFKGNGNRISATALFSISLACFVMFGHATASASVCSSALSDPDGDGWGWENNKSCSVGAPSQANSTGENFCTSAASDEDGDGWGWENNKSCMVQADSAEQPIQSTSFPVCSSASVDDDSDGWGWENNRSCVVNANSTAVASSEPSVATPSSNDVDNCSSSASDEDADGWGWENGRSCIVQQTQTPQPVETPLPTTVRFMAVGDSITHGTRRDNAQSYRKSLIELFDSNSCDYEMLGSQSSNFGHSSFVSPHEGYNGYTADQLLYGHNGPAGQSEGISVIAERYQPEVMLLHIGTNDMRLGQNVDQTVTEIDQIINTFLGVNPQSTVFVANLIPWYQAAQNQVQLLGDRIESYVAQQGDSRVRLVDVRAGYTLSMMLSDRVHPNPVGEAHVASAFFRSIQSGGFCR